MESGSLVKKTDWKGLPLIVLETIPSLPVVEEEVTETLTTSGNFPYEMESFHQCWWAHLACQFDIPVKGQDLLIHRKKLAKGLIQLREARVTGWNSAWDQVLSNDRLEELKRTSNWDYFKITLSENNHSPVLVDQLRATRYKVLELPAPCQYSVDLGQGIDGYLKGLSHNSRKSLKKKTRRGQELQPKLEDVVRAEDIDAFFEELFGHHIQYWDGKVGSSYFNKPAERQFIVNWAKALYQDGELVLDRLLMNQETVNLSMGIQTGQSFYWLLTVNTGLYLDYAPGIIGLYLRLEQCAKQGITLFHMGPGDYFYKIQSANRTTTCLDLIVINPDSLKGRLYYHWLRWNQEKASKAPKPGPVKSS